MRKVILFASLFVGVIHTSNGLFVINWTEGIRTKNEQIHEFINSDSKYTDILDNNVNNIQIFTKNNQGERSSVSETIEKIKSLGAELENKFGNISYKDLVKNMDCVAYNEKHQTLEYVCNSVKEFYTFIYSNPKYNDINIFDFTLINENLYERPSIPEIIKSIKNIAKELKWKFRNVSYKNLIFYTSQIAIHEHRTLEYVCNSAKKIYTFINSDSKYKDIPVYRICNIQKYTLNNQGERYSYTNILEAIKIKGQQVENTGRRVDYRNLVYELDSCLYHNLGKSLEDALNEIDVDRYSIKKKPGIITRVYNYISGSVAGIANSIADWWNGNTSSHKRSSSSQTDYASKRRK